LCALGVVVGVVTGALLDRASEPNVRQWGEEE
jgi:uncharacterized membrane-anchored protein YhcB (DUF1043 family)